MSAAPKNAGFTLLELLITISILMVVTAFAVPSFQSFVMMNRLATEANEFVASMNTARMEAIRGNTRGVLCRASVTNDQVSAADGCIQTTSGSWAGWMVFLDADGSGTYNPNATTNPGEVLLNTHVIRGSSSFRAIASSALGTAGNRVVYRPDGLARAPGQTLLQSATLRLCEISDTITLNARDVRLGSGSRIGVSRSTSSSCATPADS
ncbi:MAG TPA: GspH/FimT family pseudopilin [Methyloversatilis sp.]